MKNESVNVLDTSFLCNVHVRRNAINDRNHDKHATTMKACTTFNLAKKEKENKGSSSVIFHRAAVLRILETS